MKTPLQLPFNPGGGPLLFAECPLCDGVAPVDEVTGALDCPDCAIRVELSWALEPGVLAPAA